MDINFYKRLARDGVKGAGHLVEALDGSPDQPRDPDGKWSGGAGGSGKGGGERKAGEFGKPASEHEEKALAAYHEIQKAASAGKMKLGGGQKALAISQALEKSGGAAHVQTAASWHRNGLPEHIRPRTEGEYNEHGKWTGPA